MEQAYDETWDRPHRHNGKELWQESDWLTFYDPDRGAGATYRLGRQPNRRKGQPNLFSFIEGGQRFLMKELGGVGLDVDMSSDDLWDTGCRVAGHRVDALGDGRMRYRWDYPESVADLEFVESFYSPRGWDKHGKGSEIMAWINPEGHLECAGRICGWMRVGEETVEIDCMGHRDRSWGYRENYFAKMRAMLGGWGTTGRGFNFATMMLNLKTGERLVTGFVSREGREDDIIDIAFYPTMAEDMLSPVAGTVILVLENGETIRVDGNIAQSFGNYAPGVAFNGVGSLTYEGRRGFMDFSLYANPWNVSTLPEEDLALLTAAEPGLSSTQSHSISAA